MTVMDRLRLDGKNTVVTGASKNIGFSISQAFAEAGASVLMVARGQDWLETRAQQIRDATGATVHTCVADVASEQDVDRLVAYAHEVYDQVDCLVNNAANTASPGKPIFEIPDQAFEDAFATNVLGPYRLIRGLGPRMEAGRGGSIINVLSGAGFIPVKGYQAYGASKAALWMLTRYLAIDCAPTKVRANALVPGVTGSDTEGAVANTRRRTGDPTAEPESLRTVPMGRMGHPDEVAPAAVYLASDAASYTTGTVVFVNGGRPW